MTYEEIESNINYKFRDESLLKRAITLSSADNAHNNQQLECLGDALLTFIVSEKFYNDGLSEGEITARKRSYLSDEALAPVSKKLGLDVALIRGKGDTRNDKAIPSAYEALAGAIYLDGGLDAARAFALSTLEECPREDYISELKEFMEAHGEEFPPFVARNVGTVREPEFIMSIKVRGKTFSATAASKSTAKKEAAKAAYLSLIKKEEQ